MYFNSLAYAKAKGSESEFLELVAMQDPAVYVQVPLALQYVLG